jgi:hypothetical protein
LWTSFVKSESEAGDFQGHSVPYLTLITIWGVIILFFVIFVPLVTRQINYFSTIDSEKIVQIVAGPINKVENVVRSINKDIPKGYYYSGFYCEER